MNCKELEIYLRANIPLARAMGVEAVEVLSDGITLDGVILGAPLAPNINHRNTAFGGSVSALATLAAWSFLRIRLGENARGVHLVIQRNNVEYLRPVDGYFFASAGLAKSVDWGRFEDVLSRRGRARISIEAVVEYGGEVCARFEGEFVALAQE